MLPLTMADSAYLPRVAIPAREIAYSPRHSGLVIATHWIFTLGFLGLAISGFAIILAHPHFYWGESGGIGSPSLFDLPLPTMLGGPSGWGRSLHFQSAWIAVGAGLLYAIYGVLSRHFRRQMVPSRAELAWSSLRGSVVEHARFRRPAEENSYNVLQKLSYAAVIFVLFPLTILTGLGMSPVITSVIPQTVTIFGGHQSARTLHFFLADALIMFVFVHVAMVIRAGFSSRMRSMIGSRLSKEKKPL